jgi:isoleucyl-tRNA synthetase
MAPVLSFTSEEVWGYVVRGSAQGKDFSAEESVFFSSFPEVQERFQDGELEERWKKLLSLRNEVNKALELKRAEKFIGNSLEAKIQIFLPEEYRYLAEAYLDFLPAFFLVSSLTLTRESLADAYEGAYEGTDIQGLQVLVEKASGSKCQRCWNWSESVGSLSDSPDLCGKCYSVLK